MNPDRLLTTVSSCPNPEELWAYLVGRLPLPLLERIGGHLSDCTSCQLAVASVSDEGDYLASNVRHCLEPAAFLDEPECERLAARALEFTGQGDADTPPASGSGASVPALPGHGPVPELFGKFRLLHLLGRGGMGVVYKALEVPLDRVVALKMVLAGAYAEPQELARFQVEARAVARLDHPNVVRIFEAGDCDGLPYFSMELVEGGTLAQRVKDWPFAPHEAAEQILAVARGMQAAHQKGIVHRDLKPANVLLSSAGTPKVADFGLAKFLDSELVATRSNVAMGTPSYMAPEQAAGRTRDTGPTTDVWALGVMLYEMLTGHKPFPGESAEEVKHKITEEEPVPPRRLRAGLDPDLEAIALKCLEKDPRNRYPQAGALADDLQSHLAGESISARLPSRALKCWRFLRHHSRLSVVAGVLALLVVTVLVALHLANPLRTARQLQEQLARGETVVLLEEGNSPPSSSWPLGEGTITRPSRKNLHFSINAFQAAYLELLPEGQPPAYWLRAEILNPNYEFAQAGICFAHTGRLTGQGLEHCYFLLTFRNDWEFPKGRATTIGNVVSLQSQIGALGLFPRGPLHALPSFYVPRQELPRNGKVELSICRTPGPQALTKSKYVGTMGISQSFQSLPSEGQTAWRRLAVRVAPEGLQVWWEGQCIGTADRDFIIKRARHVLADNPELHPNKEFLPAGGLGLYVENGGASFRRVHVEPLP
jgi:serine/threonine-protein kinase